jgi:alkanesulfonate monooxygenase SsuD/methylene tetrahydromethanopterin reductase-like flavin-dependent oxidoreductase (luciferase family)
MHGRAGPSVLNTVVSDSGLAPAAVFDQIDAGRPVETRRIHALTVAAGNLHLAAALDGAGWHPAAWREPDARPAELFTAGYWVDLALEAERGLLDFVTLEDSLALQSSRYGDLDGRTDQVRGRLDAVLVAARVAPRTDHLGFIPSVTVTHTEPFHISKAIATLDYVSGGRAGVRVQVSARHHEAAHFGRRQLGVPAGSDVRDRRDPAVQAAVAELFDEAADYVEVLRRLWDSWEDDAEIRDVATGRFIDRHKLHYIDFEGRFFNVKGPSITPRPPQGQPIVAALAHQSVPYRLVGRSADIGFVTPHDPAGAARIVEEIGAEWRRAGRVGEGAEIFADLVVFLDDTSAAAQSRKRRLDELAGEEYPSDAEVFVGTPAQLADLLEAWRAGGLSGFRLRPGAIPHDLEAVTRGLVPELQRRGVFRRSYRPGTLRERLGLPRPANRYAA